jgi:hypothetical protein
MKTYRNMPVIRDIFAHVASPMDVVISVEAALIDGTVTRPAGSLSAATGFILRDAAGQRICIVKDINDLAAILWVLTEKTTTSVMLDLRADRRAAGQNLQDVCEDIQLILNRKLRVHDAHRMSDILMAFRLPQSRHGQIEITQRLQNLGKNPDVLVLIKEKVH